MAKVSPFVYIALDALARGHMRNRTLNLFVLFVLSALAAPSWACTPASPEMLPTDSTQIVEIKIGDSYFKFPESFISTPENRVPGPQDSFGFAVSPDFTPEKEMPADYHPGDSNRLIDWKKEHPSINIIIKKVIKEPEPSVPQISEGAPPPPLPMPPVPLSEMPFVNMNHSLTKMVDFDYTPKILVAPEIVEKKLRSYMFEKPSNTWAADNELAEALRYRGPGPCDALSNAGKPAPEPPPIIARDIINKGLGHKNSGIRLRALVQLVSYKDSAEVAKTIYDVATTDKEYAVRLTALRILVGYKPSIDAGPLLMSLLLHDTNDNVIRHAAQLLLSLKPDVVPILADIPIAKGQRLYSEIEFLARSINHEVRSEKLMQYDQLSEKSKLALNAVMNFYERPDVTPEEKARIRNILQNSKSAIGTKRYVDLLVRQKAVAEIGSVATHAELAVPFLINELKSNRVGNYSYVVQALGNFGTAAKSALPHIEPLTHFDCPNANAGQNMAPPLPSFSPDPTVCQPYLVDQTRRFATDAIARINGNAK